MKLLSSQRTFCVHHTTMHKFTVSSHSKPHRKGAYLFRCTLLPALLAEWLWSSTCYCSNTGGGMNTKIRVSTESWPGRRTFSCRYCGDSNWGPFDHESGALTTEPSLSQTRQKKKGGERKVLSGTFLQTLPDLVTPLKGHSLSQRSCPAMQSAPSERLGY